MRMVFTNASEDEFYRARDRLVTAYGKWARQQNRPAEPFVVEVVLEQRWEAGDGLLSRWQPTDFRRVLLDWFPRKVSLPADAWGPVIPALHTFVDFLYAEDLADRFCAKAADLHADLDATVVHFVRAMGDESRYGVSKFWTTRMMTAGVDTTDPVAMQRYIDRVQSGMIVVDQDLLDQVVANHVNAIDEATGQSPTLPVVALADETSLREAAGRAVALTRLQRFVEWVGTGRTLTTTGQLRPADTRGLTDLMDPDLGGQVWKTRSSQDRYETTLVLAWAKECRVVRVVRGRLVPVKSAAKLLADPLSLARRAFEAFFTLGPEVGRTGKRLGSLIGLRFGDVTFALILALYTEQAPVAVADLTDIAIQVAEEGFDLEAEISLSEHSTDVRLLLDQLVLLGVLERTRNRLTMTPLGVALSVELLREAGATAPTVTDLLDETAEVVVAAATDAPPEVRDRLMTAWRAHQAESAVPQLTALATRTDDRKHRELARKWSRP